MNKIDPNVAPLTLTEVTLRSFDPKTHWGEGRVSEDTHSLTFLLIDGRLPAGTYTHPDGHTITVGHLEG